MGIPPFPVGPGHPPRLRGYDYTSCGAYFVTVVTRDRAEVLGTVSDGVVLLSAAGEVVLSAWKEIPRRFPFVRLDEFVVMPNHLHGILSFEAPEDALVGGLTVPPSRRHLDIVVQTFKSLSTIAVNRVLHRPGISLWQRGYFEHVVRDDRALESIRGYISGNPEAWPRDRYNARNRR